MSTSDVRKVRLRVEALSPLTEIRVSDARYRDIKLPANVGEIDTLLPQGVYQVSFREGKGWQNELVLLSSGGSEPIVVKQPVPAQTRSFAAESQEDEAPESPASPEFSVVTVTARIINKPDDPNMATAVAPLTNVTLVSADEEKQANVRVEDQGGSTRQKFDVPPGYWRLRLADSNAEQQFEMPLVVCPSWHTFVGVAFDVCDGRCTSRWEPSESQIRLSANATSTSDASELRSYERAALQSLTGRRSLHGHTFRDLLRRLLNDKLLNPMLGIYGGHLLPCETEEDKLLADEVIGNLEFLVHGPAGPVAHPEFRHPDVEALKLRLLLLRNQPLDSIQPFHFPPMLAAGWRLLIEACQKRPDLIPTGSVTAEISARLVTAGPWIAWSRPRRTPSAWLATLRASGVPSVAAAPAFAPAVAIGPGPFEAAAVPAPASQSGSAATAESYQDWEENCRIIRAALAHRSLREWYRRAVAMGERDDVLEPSDTVEIDQRERLLAGALRSIAADEERQRIFDITLIRHARNVTEPTSATELATQLGLPLTAVREAAETLAWKFATQARKASIDLKARSAMAVPELIIPYDPEFLGDGFVVPPPTLSDPLRMQAYADATAIDYTHFSLVMHAGRRVAIFAANNIDASRKVRVAGGLSWRMDERVGEYQLGPEVYVDNQLDRGHMVRREDVLWGTVSEARLANKSTYFYSNAAPQHQNFNQDEWVTLEDWVLDRATDFSYRLCVFTGPVLRDNDPTLEELPQNLRTAFQAHGPAQIPAAFWKVIVLRDASAAGEDLSVVAFAMRQSEMWNDKQGRQLLNLKVHQVTLQAIEEWTGLDFGNLKQADELAWSDDRSRLRAAGQVPEWPQIRSGADIVFSGASRRARGARASRGAGTRSTASSGRLRALANCGCNEPDVGFDTRAAIEALNRDIVRLTDLLATQSRSAELQADGPQPAGGVRSVVPVSHLNAVNPEVDDPRVAEMVARAPDAIKGEMREFARTVIEQGDVARGTRRASAPRELERIIGGEDVPPGGFLSCVCIGDATDWFCTGVVIAPRVVLTAAHCGRTITRVMVGGTKVKPRLDASARIISVQTVEVHSAYRAHPYNENDINLLILSETAMVPPVPIATPEQLRAAAGVQLVGFGYNDPQRPLGFGTKRQVQVPMAPIIKLSNDENLSALEAQLGFHSAYEFVAGRKGLGIDTCNGDSGGPAYLATPPGGFVLAGLTSRATTAGVLPCGDGGIYVRPDRFLDWINGAIARAGLQLLPT